MLSESGVRYSVLLELPYFDPIRFHVIDPMHNLLLGTAKRMMVTWTEAGLLSNKVFDELEDRVKRISAPKDIG